MQDEAWAGINFSNPTPIPTFKSAKNPTPTLNQVKRIFFFVKIEMSSSGYT